jgi:hypothetical protein
VALQSVGHRRGKNAFQATELFLNQKNKMCILIL